MPHVLVDHRKFLLERFSILALAGLYLYLFRTPVPNGDGLVYIGNITDMRDVWNPNHLLMDPAGRGFHRLLSEFGIDLSPFHALKLLSGAAALASLVIFHAVLVQIGVRSPASRLLSVAGLFFSRNFISMGLSEEFFMIQMPLLMIVLWCCARWTNETGRIPDNNALLPAMGGLLGAAAAIAINNVFLVLALGIGVAVAHPRGVGIRWKNTLRVWLVSGLVLFPILLFGYFRSGAGSGFVAWLTSYQGQSANVSRSLYGIEWSLKGIALSMARLTYNLFANFIDLGGIGTVAKGKVFSIPLDFAPDYAMVSLGAAILAILVVMVLMLMIWVFREGTGDPFVRIGLAWIAGCLLFNFYWNDSSDQFYFQILPIAWTFVPMAAGNTKSGTVGPGGQQMDKYPVMKRVFPLLLVVPIMTLNTLNSVVPAAFDDVEGKRKAHRDILKVGDLEIVPGWDGLPWISTGDGAPIHRRITLMDLAMRSNGKDGGMKDLPVTVREHLSSGKRVIVARLYDLDGVARPWDQLRKLGWPRKKIQNLLKEFDSRIIGNVGGVTFRELSLPEMETRP